MPFSLAQLKTFLDSGQHLDGPNLTEAIKRLIAELEGAHRKNQDLEYRVKRLEDNSP